MTNSLSIFNQLRPFSVGFDNVFNQFESLFDSDMRMIGTPNYPPYNIVKQDNYKYDIEIALAGFGKKDIKVEVEDGRLTVESKKLEDKNGNEVIHKGISKRSFKRTWTIADDVEITGAELKDGLLKVSMEHIVPEKKKLKTISIK